jgi:hypothetical protein
MLLDMVSYDVCHRWYQLHNKAMQESEKEDYWKAPDEVKWPKLQASWQQLEQLSSSLTRTSAYPNSL